MSRQKPGISKSWWTDGLTELKNKSIEIHNIWKNDGRQRQGPINQERLRVKAAYKSALRAAQRAPKQAEWDQLHLALSDNDTKFLPTHFGNHDVDFTIKIGISYHH